MKPTDQSRLTRARNAVDTWYARRNASTYCYDQWQLAIKKFNTIQKTLRQKYTGAQTTLL